MDDFRTKIKKKIDNEEFNCEKELTLSIINGQWKITMLYHLGMDGALRFSDITRLFPAITHKVLTTQLRELEDDGIIHREVFPEVPPRVQYSLTDPGQRLMHITMLML